MHILPMLTGTTQSLAIQRLTTQALALLGLNAAQRGILLVDLAGVSTDAPFQLFNRHFAQHPIERGRTWDTLAPGVQTSDQFLAMGCGPFGHRSPAALSCHQCTRYHQQQVLPFVPSSAPLARVAYPLQMLGQC